VRWGPIDLRDTVRANRDVSRRDLTVSLLGRRLPAPVLLAPADGPGRKTLYRFPVNVSGPATYPPLGRK
jgi:hypothetical protein